MNKSELLSKIETAHSEWQSLLSEVGEARMTEPGVTGDWSVKDIIGHIAAWEQRVLDRVRSDSTGETLEMTGWDMDKMNETYFERSRAASLKDVLSDAADTHSRFMQFVGSLSEQQLFEGGIYGWTQGQPLYNWITGNTYEHYDEHSAPIREWLGKTNA